MGRRVSALAGDVAAAPPSRPTYRELATAGTGLVAALADDGPLGRGGARRPAT